MVRKSMILKFLLDLMFISTWGLITSCDDTMEIAGEDVTNTGLPIVRVNTPDNATITRKYTQGTQVSIEDVEGGIEISSIVGIKGRGNSSWIYYPKKSYLLDFEDKETFLGFPEGRTWVLLANYNDLSLMRNDIAFFMGREMGLLDYTPQSCFVDLILNDSYKGIYQLAENLEVGAERMDVGNDGFLLEIDGKAHYDDVTFQAEQIYHPVNIKYPEVTENDANFVYVRDFFLQAERTLFSDQFLNPNEGYRKYLDMDSFVEWYLINEIAKNNDAAFYTSCFMHMRKGGKLCMGPVWDFDMAFGGYKANKQGKVVNNPEGFHIKNVKWFARLFEDPAFVARVKQRFMDYYARRGMIYQHIDENERLLLPKIVMENYLWGCVSDNSSSDQKVMTAYHRNLDNMKDWLEKRFVWLKNQIDAF